MYFKTEILYQFLYAGRHYSFYIFIQPLRNIGMGLGCSSLVHHLEYSYSILECLGLSAGSTPNPSFQLTYAPGGSRSCPSHVGDLDGLPGSCYSFAHSVTPGKQSLGAL